MARVTVEDCVVRVPNRFDLVMLAAQRARALTTGAPLSIERDNDKNPVVALREIAEATVSFDSLRNDLVRGHQRLPEPEEPEPEVTELMREPEWARLSEQDGGDDEEGDADIAADDSGEGDEIDEPVPDELAEPFDAEPPPFE